MNRTVVALLALLGSVLGPFARAAEAASQFPVVAGKTLNETDLRLPAELPAEVSILILTFEQNQQDAAERWTAGLTRRLPAIPLLEIAVIAPVNAFVRGMIISGMRRGIPEPSRRARFVTVFTGVDVAHEVGCPHGARETCVIVAERNGRVRQVAAGDYADSSADDLITALKSLTQ